MDSTFSEISLKIVLVSLWGKKGDVYCLYWSFKRSRVSKFVANDTLRFVTLKKRNKSRSNNPTAAKSIDFCLRKIGRKLKIFVEKLVFSESPKNIKNISIGKPTEKRKKLAKWCK